MLYTQIKIIISLNFNAEIAMNKDIKIPTILKSLEK